MVLLMMLLHSSVELAHDVMDHLRCYVLHGVLYCVDLYSILPVCYSVYSISSYVVSLYLSAPRSSSDGVTSSVLVCMLLASISCCASGVVVSRSMLVVTSNAPDDV